MQFRTELTPKKSPLQISESMAQLWLGSCFATSIGGRLLEAKFPIMLNPFGTVFNPISLFQQIKSALNQENPPSHKFLKHENLYYHFDYHSELRESSQELLQQRLLTLQNLVRGKLLNSQYLVMTFGTAYAYHLQNSGEIVTNCHKQTSKQFQKKLLSVEAILQEFSGLYQLLQQENPSLKIILTVSPIRHLKDTLPLNSVSKATLRLATHQICEQHPTVSYFPAYELLLDDLRDYRFYETDMLHPSLQAQDYIWQKFQNTFLTDTAQNWLKAWSEISRALAHRPFNPYSEAHQQFLKKTLQKIQKYHPEIDLSNEIKELKRQISSE